jgi:hypothetical protein
VEITSDANNKYLGRESVNAEGFVPPFVNAEAGQQISAANHAQRMNEVSVGQHGTTGLEFAGTGEVEQLNKVTFGHAPVLYKQIAASIQGAPLQSAEQPRVIEQPQVPLGRAAVVGAEEVRSAQALQRRLYGSGEPRVPFQRRCSQALRGALYDLLHFEEFREQHRPGGCVDAVHQLCTRDGRGPYIGFLLLALVLIAVCLLIPISAARSPQYPSYTSAYMPMPVMAPAYFRAPAPVANAYAWTR